MSFAMNERVNIPPAPWILNGEAICMMASPFTFRLLVDYRSSPVGPYQEHALVKIKRKGIYVAPHVFQMSVDSPASEIGGRTIWGFPKTLETLSWSRKGSRIEFIRERQRFRFRPFGLSFPIVMPFHTLQKREDEWVKVPGLLRGKCQGAFRGRQFAVIVSDFSLVIAPPVEV